MKRTSTVWWGVRVALTLALIGVTFSWAPAQEPKSSDAAIKQYRAAVAFQNRQVYDLAVDEWVTFLKKHSDDPLAAKAQHYLGVCYFQQQNYPEAQTAFEKVLAEHPKFELLSQTLVNLGLAQFNQGQQGRPGALQQAVSTFELLLEKFPQTQEAPLAWYYQAETLYSLDKKPEALTAYAKLVEQFPQHTLRSKALYGLGVAQEETGATAAAAQSYDTFLKEFSDDELATEVGMRRGETLLAQGDFAEAEKRFAAAAAVEGFEFADYARLRQAACRYELKQYGEAGKLYAELVAAFPDSPYAETATLAAGKCYFLAGDHAQAQSWLEKSRALGGDVASEASHWLARTLLREAKPAEALKVVEAALPAAEESPLLPDLKMDQADALYEISERRSETVALYGKLFEAYPDHAIAPQAGYMAAYSALGVGDYEQALTRATAFLNAQAEHELVPDVLYVQAESQMQLQRYDQAEANFKQLLAKYADRPEAQQWLVRRGLCLFLQKKYAEVVELLTAQAGTLKTPETLAEAHFLVGSSQFELKQYPPAIQTLQASLAAAPEWRQADETLLLLGRAQGEAGDRAAALATLQTMIERFPESPVLDQTHFRLGELQYGAGEYSAAAASYAKVLENWPDSMLGPYASFGLGWANMSQQQFEPAAQAFTTLLEKHGDHELAPRARYARAMAQQQLGDFEAALADAESFLQTNPTGAEKSDILYVRGLSAAGLKKFAEAAESFQAILENDPQYAAADKVLYELAWAHLEQNQTDQAQDIFARLGKEHPQSELAAESLYRVGEFQYQNKEFAQSAVSYYGAFNKAGKTELGEKAVHKLAWAYFQQKDYDRALQSYRSQIDNFPTGVLSADAQAMIGECLFQQQKYADAFPALQKAIEKKPASSELQVLTLLHAGQAAAQLEKWAESLQLLERCATEFPDSAYLNEALYEQAWAQQNLGKMAEAAKLYETVADNTDAIVGARARFMLGELQFADKKYDEAVRSFFKVAYGYGHPNAPAGYHTWQADATFEAARCLEMLRKPEAAKKLYKELVELYPQSDKLDDARQKLMTLGG